MTIPVAFPKLATSFSSISPAPDKPLCGAEPSALINVLPAEERPESDAPIIFPIPGAMLLSASLARILSNCSIVSCEQERISRRENVYQMVLEQIVVSVNLAHLRAKWRSKKREGRLWNN